MAKFIEIGLCTIFESVINFGKLYFNLFILFEIEILELHTNKTNECWFRAENVHSSGQMENNTFIKIKLVYKLRIKIHPFMGCLAYKKQIIVGVRLYFKWTILLSAVFNRSAMPNHPINQIQGGTIELKNDVNYLGVTLDHRLNFDKHIDSLVAF